MKIPSDDLFKLIKSLSKQEKVYFKQYASRKKEHNNYIVLFDFIDSMNIYDERELKTKLKSESFIKNLK